MAPSMSLPYASDGGGPAFGFTYWRGRADQARSGQTAPLGLPSSQSNASARDCFAPQAATGGLILIRARKFALPQAHVR